MQPTNRIDAIYQQPGFLALQGTTIDVDKHRHRALQLLLPGPGGCEARVADQAFTTHQALLLNSQVAHGVASEEALILLADPACHLGKRLQQKLAGADFLLLDDTSPATPSLPSAPYTASESSIHGYLQALGLAGCTRLHLEPRITLLLEQVHRAFAEGRGDTINLAWALGQVPLSSSRFQHLFRAQLGMPWRAWLAWTRLLHAAELTMAGATLTEAAIAAGFSDSAHFSHTFKALFGITPARVTLPPAAPQG